MIETMNDDDCLSLGFFLSDFGGQQRVSGTFNRYIFLVSILDDYSLITLDSAISCMY